MVETVLLGTAVGLAFGYALQRGPFGMTTMFRALVRDRDLNAIRPYVLAVAIQLVGVNALTEVAGIPRPMAPFWWPAALLGGLVFGIGMVMSDG